MVKVTETSGMASWFASFTVASTGRFSFPCTVTLEGIRVMVAGSTQSYNININSSSSSSSSKDCQLSRLLDVAAADSATSSKCE